MILDLDGKLDKIDTDLLLNVDILSPNDENLNKSLIKEFNSSASTGSRVKPNFIFTIGGPTSGKTVNSKRAAGKFGFQYISIGDELRREIEMMTKLGVDAKRYLKQGELVPNELIFEIITRALTAWPAKHYIIDGFPRTVDQALFFEKQMGSPSKVLYFDAPEDQLVERAKQQEYKSNRVDTANEVA